MEKHSVEVTRIGYGGTLTIEVEAERKEKAVELALDEAGDHVFKEHSSEYVELEEEGEYPVYLFLGEDASKIIENINPYCRTKTEIAAALTEEYGNDVSESERDIDEMIASITIKKFHTQAEANAFYEGVELAMGYLGGLYYLGNSKISKTEETLIYLKGKE